MSAAPTPDPRTVALLTDDQLDDTERAARLLPLLYDELRRQAARVLRDERRAHTLQPTALVHEAFLRLVGPRRLSWHSRGQFFAAAAQAMRQILVDHARRRGAAKRGGAEARRAAIDLAGLPDPRSERETAGFLILDDAILRLADVDPGAAAVVRLRYFAGLGVEPTAAALGISAATVKRTWAFARAWLRQHILDHDC